MCEAQQLIAVRIGSDHLFGFLAFLVFFNQLNIFIDSLLLLHSVSQ
jgi:hypothetical protein